MLTCEHNGINETNFIVNNQVVLIKHYYMHDSGFHKQGPFTKLIFCDMLLTRDASIHSICLNPKPQVFLNQAPTEFKCLRCKQFKTPTA